MSRRRSPERRTYGEHPSQFLDLYLADASLTAPRGTIISIHGGYWREAYGLDLNEPVAHHLANRGWTVANLEYRRIAPGAQGVWAEMSSDILDAIALVDDAPGPTIVVGHSAGGQLALWAAAQPANRVDGVIALAPLCDLFLADGLELSNHATAELFGASASDRPDLYAAASPLYLLPLNMAQLVVHGRADEDVPFAMAPEYVETAELAGDEVTLLDPKKVDHFDVIDPTHSVWRSIDAWLDRLDL